MRRTILLLPAALLLFASTVAAGGFMIFEHGASGTGMAGARTAAAVEPNALFYNPAAISELPGFQFTLGTTGILPYTHYEPARDSDRMYISSEDGQRLEKPVVEDGTHPTDAKIRGFSPIHLYATYNIEPIGLTVGYGLNNPFGLGTYWPGDWDGRFINTESEMVTFVHQPTVAVDIARLAGFKEHLKLSVAVGYDLVHATALLARKIDLRAAEQMWIGPFQDAEGEMRMTGSAIGHGWNAALYAELPGWFSFGFSVRSGIRLPFSGTARFTFNDAGQLARERFEEDIFNNQVLPDETGGKVEIVLPWNLNLGIAYLGVENLRIEFDFYIGFFQSFDEIDLRFDCVEKGTCSALETQEPIPKDWGSSMQFALGAEYLLFDSLFLRAGYGLATSAAPAHTYDPSLPDGLRSLICFGAGYKGSWWKVDLGYMLAIWEDTKDNLVGIGTPLNENESLVDPDGNPVLLVNGNPEGFANGTYSIESHLLALSLTGWF